MTGGITLTVRDLLARQTQRGLFFAASTDSVQQAAIKMQDHGISAIVEIDGEGHRQQLVGILSEKDVSRLSARGGDPAKTHVGALMSTALITVEPDTSLMETAHFMLTNNIRHLPVIEMGQPISTISMRDVLGLLINTLESENESLRTDLNWMRQVQGQ